MPLMELATALFVRYLSRTVEMTVIRWINPPTSRLFGLIFTIMSLFSMVVFPTVHFVEV